MDPSAGRSTWGSADGRHVGRRAAPPGLLRRAPGRRGERPPHGRATGAARAAAERPPNPAEQRRRAAARGAPADGGGLRARAPASAAGAPTGRPARRRGCRARTGSRSVPRPSCAARPPAPPSCRDGSRTSPSRRDGRRVYAATANGGVWRSLDAGDSWEPMSDEHDLDLVARQVDSLAAARSPSSRAPTPLTTGSTSAPVRATPLGTRTDTGEDTSARPPRRRHAALGRRWRDVAPGGRGAPTLVGSSVYAIAVDPSDPEHAVAATTNGVYRRTAAVPTWTGAAAGPATGAGGGQRPDRTTTSAASPSPATAARPSSTSSAEACSTSRPRCSARPPPASGPSSPASRPVLEPLHDRRRQHRPARPLRAVVRRRTAASTGITRFNLGRAAPIPWEATTDAPTTCSGQPEHRPGRLRPGARRRPQRPGHRATSAAPGKTIGGEFSANDLPRRDRRPTGRARTGARTR